MGRARWSQETCTKRFQEVYEGWQDKRLTQEEAGQLLEVSGRSFRRQISGYEADGIQRQMDVRMSQVSNRYAPVDELLDVQRLYRSNCAGWNVRHFHTRYARDHRGSRSYASQISGVVC